MTLFPNKVTLTWVRTSTYEFERDTIQPIIPSERHWGCNATETVRDPDLMGSTIQGRTDTKPKSVCEADSRSFHFNFLPLGHWELVFQLDEYQQRSWEPLLIYDLYSQGSCQKRNKDLPYFWPSSIWTPFSSSAFVWAFMESSKDMRLQPKYSHDWLLPNNLSLEQWLLGAATI